MRDQKPSKSVTRFPDVICNGITINEGIIASASSVMIFMMALYIRIVRCKPVSLGGKSVAETH
jgi:hypothetical protein